MRVHIAVAVKDIAESVPEYTQLLGTEPEVVVENEYALWRTPVLNFSIRQTAQGSGTVRHVGFERDDAERFVEYRDINGLIWETFTPEQQAAEIRALWPHAYDSAQSPKS